MDWKLAARALSSMVLGLALVMLLLFFPAGTWDYPDGWRLIALLFIPMLIVGLYLLVKSPALLAKRLNNREKEQQQRLVILLSAIIFVAGFVLAGLDFRFGWSHLPHWLIVLASVILLVGYGLYAEVLRENAYLSRVVEVQADQRVIDTGLYAIVRHPMYFATVLFYLAMPLVLGSAVALAPFLLYIPIIVLRIRNEEAVLVAGLPGYAAYRRRVRYRLIPFVW